MKYLSAGGMPHKLPTSLVHLENLFLEVCMTEQNQISSALCMIRSSQLLVKIKFLMYDDEKVPVRKTTNFLDPDDYSNLNLDHLEIFEIKKISSNLPLVMDLVKLIMAKSPVLKTVQMELKDNVSVDEEVKMLRDLVLVQVPRASPSAKLIIVRPKTS
ncbi:putative FBD domain-containing protein [Helianthus annuus]|nr:putative FBD domain-containing protein [Helianthus annuus]KAJ0642658.1 putative FBD domain-containing protein [Helianthus annuus]KAJ0646536.1 putative FBD domain-containing protein [Helianthus annuus]KAJ0823249.1 putative FBD domain-containing protein [Helianthus annuus]